MGISEEDAFCHRGDPLTLKVFMQIHFKLPQFIDIHGFVVFALSLSEKPPFGRFKYNIEFRTLVTIWGGMKSEDRECNHYRVFQRFARIVSSIASRLATIWEPVAIAFFVHLSSPDFVSV